MIHFIKFIFCFSYDIFENLNIINNIFMEIKIYYLGEVTKYSFNNYVTD